MTTFRTLAFVCLILCTTPGFTAGPNHGARALNAKTVVSMQVRSAARKLANVWVEQASPPTLDSLAQRSIAFAGMVPGTYVVLDGKRFSAPQALMDSALTILNLNNFEADAGAIRKIVYTLMEIAEGRARRGPK